MSFGVRREDLGIVLLWAVLLSAILSLPYLTGSSTPGDDLIRNTVRLSLAYYAAAVTLMLLLQPAEWVSLSRRAQKARWWWTLAWAAFLVHLGMAFHHSHHWSHEHAVEHTQEVSGFGPGIYLSHLFTLLWTADVGYWWFRPRHYAARSRWVDGLLHVYMFFIIFNGTVVYEEGPIRWAGVLLTVVLAGLIIYRTRAWGRKAAAEPTE